MVDLLLALDFRRVVGEILVDGEAELERATFVHALVRVDGEDEVEEIVRVRECRLHCLSKGALKFCQIWDTNDR